MCRKFLDLPGQPLIPPNIEERVEEMSTVLNDLLNRIEQDHQNSTPSNQLPTIPTRKKLIEGILLLSLIFIIGAVAIILMR
jgi:hypothetical protein